MLWTFVVTPGAVGDARNLQQQAPMWGTTSFCLMVLPTARSVLVSKKFATLRRAPSPGVGRGCKGVIVIALWCGVVVCGVVVCGVVWWCGGVCCGVLCCGVLCCGVVWCAVVWCGVVVCGGVVWCGVVCGVVV